MISVVVFGFIFGIFLGSIGFFNLGYILAVLFLSFIFFLYKFFVEKEYQKIIFFASIFLLFTSFGIIRIYFSDLNQTSALEPFVEKQASFKGLIVSEPDVREKSVKLTVLVKEISSGVSTTTVSEKIIISTNLYPEFNYGDEIYFKTSISRPSKIESETGRIFDYKNYLRVRGIWYTASFVYPKIISENNGNVIKKYLFSIKKSFVNSLNNSLPEPESSLLGGILLGSKQSLGKDLLSDFSKTGVSHIVVLSGYNIAIVANSIMASLSFLPSFLSVGFGCLGIILFTILSGAEASAIRASIMVLVALIIKKTNREYRAGRILGFAIILMLFPNPLLLVFDPSFQLSFLATLGLVFVSPIIEPYFYSTFEKLALKKNYFLKKIGELLQNKILGEVICTTLATQITVLPFLVYSMGNLSLISLPVNVLILIFIPTVMFLGFITGLLGFVSSYLVFITGTISYVILKYQLSIISFGASLPFASVSIQGFSFYVLILIYILIFGSLYFLQKQKPQVFCFTK